MSADLHVHSIYSDGSFTPLEIINMAENVGLSTIALADHDTVEGITEMVDAGSLKGIDVIPAIEFSTFQSGSEIHILGYYIDYKSQAFLSRIEELFRSRIDRAEKMVKKLNELGIKISYQDVQGIAGDKYIGRPHIAKAMIEAGYIKTMGEAFSNEYIANGGRAYISKESISPAEAIDIIHQAGGIAVMAHPYFINNGNPFECQDIKNLVSAGLEGIEVFHSKHDRKTVDYYMNIAKKLDLLITGGSDFHGDNSSIELGSVLLSDKYVFELKEYYHNKRVSSP